MGILFIIFLFLALPLVLSSLLSKHKSIKLNWSVSIGIIFVVGAAFLFLSLTMPWYDWMYQGHGFPVSLWKANELAASLMLGATLFSLASLLINLLILRLFSRYLTFVAAMLVFSLLLFLMLKPATSTGVVSVGLDLGVLMGSVGAVLILLGAALDLLFVTKARGREFLKVRRRTGWQAVLLWSLAFAGVAFTVVSIMSIGGFIAPFTLTFILLVALWANAWPEAPLGTFIGMGLLCLLVAFINRGYVPCPSGVTIGLTPGRTSWACGGLNPVPWLVVGVLLVVAGISYYLLFAKYGPNSREP